MLLRSIATVIPKRLVAVVLVLGTVIALSTAGYVAVEHWSWFDLLMEGRGCSRSRLPWPCSRVFSSVYAVRKMTGMASCARICLAASMPSMIAVSMMSIRMMSGERSLASEIASAPSLAMPMTE